MTATIHQNPPHANHATKPPLLASTPRNPATTFVPNNQYGKQDPYLRHEDIIEVIDSDEELMPDVESLLSLGEARRLSRGRLRLIECPWHGEGGCDACLGSVELLEKHLALHLDRATAPAHQHEISTAETDDTSSDRETASLVLDGETDLFKCKWERCPQHFIDMGALQRHIATVHIRKLTLDFCPHRNCTRPYVPSEKLPIHTKNWHPLPWREADLKPSTLPVLAEPPRPPSLDPGWTVPSWYICIPAVQPHRPGPNTPELISGIAIQMRRERSRKSRSSTPPSRPCRMHPIVPDRADEVFSALCGDAFIFNSLDSSTSSIFPSTGPRSVDADTRRLSSILSQDRWRQHSPLAIVPRPTKMRRPLIWNGAIAYAKRRRAELEVEKVAKKQKVDEEMRMLEQLPDADEVYEGTLTVVGSTARGKLKPLTKTPTETDTSEMKITVTIEAHEVPATKTSRFDVERIRRASHRRATRLIGMSFGMDHMEERVAFEKSGVEYGELPDDHFPWSP